MKYKSLINTQLLFSIFHLFFRNSGRRNKQSIAVSGEVDGAGAGAGRADRVCAPRARRSTAGSPAYPGGERLGQGRGEGGPSGPRRARGQLRSKVAGG